MSQRGKFTVGGHGRVPDRVAIGSTERPALETLDDKLKRLRYTLTEAQAILTDVLNAARAAGVADLATTDGQGRKRTGVRMVRGTHGVSYVADPDGTDVLPAGMQAPLAATGKEHE